jgi:hypothetical protein
MAFDAILYYQECNFHNSLTINYLDISLFFSNSKSISLERKS